MQVGKNQSPQECLLVILVSVLLDVPQWVPHWCVYVSTGAEGIWKQRQFLQTLTSLQLVLSDDNHTILKAGRDLRDHLVQPDVTPPQNHNSGYHIQVPLEYATDWTSTSWH